MLNTKKPCGRAKPPDQTEKLWAFALRVAGYFASWLVLFACTRTTTYLLNPPQDLTLPEILPPDTPHDLVWAALLTIPTLLVGPLHTHPLTQKCAATLEKPLVLALYLLLTPLALSNALYISWAGSPFQPQDLKSLSDTLQLHSSVLEILSRNPLATLPFLLLTPLLMSLLLNQKKTSAALLFILLAQTLFGIALLVNKTAPKPPHYEAIHKNFLASLYHAFTSNPSQPTKPPNSIDPLNHKAYNIATSIRESLIPNLNPNDSFLNNTYPLAKYTTSFRSNNRHPFAKDLQLEKLKPHIVLILLESGRSLNIHSLGGKDPNLTPNIDTLVSNGITWKNFTSHTTTSWVADISLFAGVYGPPNWDVFNPTDSPAMPVKGLPTMLQEIGYQSELYHNGPLYYWGFKNSIQNLGFQTIRGAEFLDPNNDYLNWGWGIPDKALFQKLSSVLNQKVTTKAPPSFVVIRNITTHHPFELPPEEIPYHSNPKTSTENYENVLHYTDKQLGDFFKTLTPETRNSCVFLIVGDHSVPLESHWYDYPSPESLLTPCILYAPGFTYHTGNIEEVASHTDICATIADIVNYQGTNHIIGNSLLNRRSPKENLAYFSNAKNWEALRYNHWLYLYKRETQEERLLDLQQTPPQSFNLKNSPQPVKEQIHHLHKTLENLYWANSALWEGSNLEKEKNPFRVALWPYHPIPDRPRVANTHPNLKTHLSPKDIPPKELIKILTTPATQNPPDRPQANKPKGFE